MNNIKKTIITTTINPPTKAILSFLKLDDWNIIIAGDKKTPEDDYRKLEESFTNLKYLSCYDQEKKYPELSAILGWYNIQRRNIAFVDAYNSGADIIATIDDDNMPYYFWGTNLLIDDKFYPIKFYDSETEIFDPLSVTNNKHLWHRGFPLSLVSKKNEITYKGIYNINVHVQSDLWGGDPDIDAFQRITMNPCVNFDVKSPYKGTKISPFNSQNTFLMRKCFPDYSVLPFVGRLDDIWGGYILQIKNPNLNIIYNEESVYQQRNEHNLIRDLKNEILGYEYTLEFINKLKEDNGNLNLVRGILPRETIEFYNIYREQFKI